MISYSVQYELPVDKPSASVSKKVDGRVVTFYVPVNHPSAHNMGYAQLCAAVQFSKLSALSTPLNKNRDSHEERVVLEKMAKKQLDGLTPGRVGCPPK